MFPDPTFIDAEDGNYTDTGIAAFDYTEWAQLDLRELEREVKLYREFWDVARA